MWGVSKKPKMTPKTELLDKQYELFYFFYKFLRKSISSLYSEIG